MSGLLCIHDGIRKREFDFAGKVEAVAGDPLVEALVEFFIVDVVVGLAFAGLDAEDLGEPVLVGRKVQCVEFDADSA